MRIHTWFASRALLVAWLTVIWVLLWGSVSVANVLTGVLGGLAVVRAFPPAITNDAPFVIRPLPALSLLVWFLKALVITNIAVAREVLVPRSKARIRTAIVAVPLQTTSGRLATIIANAITLTPGTLTVDARGRPAVLFVHVLAFPDEVSVRDEVADLERRVVRAFGTADEVRRICPTSRSTTTGDAHTGSEVHGS